MTLSKKVSRANHAPPLTHALHALENSEHYGPLAVSSEWHSDRPGTTPVPVIYKGIVISAIGPTYWSDLRTCERYISNQLPQSQLLSRPKHMSKTGIMRKGNSGTLALEAGLPER